jgi:hypothetical protein
MRATVVDGLLRGVPVFVCLVVLGLHLEVWAARAAYPYDLEWMEGGMLAHGWRLQHGLPLYVAPNPDFVPFVYPPGYPAVLAALGDWFGLSPRLGRLVSVVGVLLAAAGAGFQVGRATGSGRAALFTGTVVVATWQAAGHFYDLVRPDGLLLGLLAWALALAAERGRGTAVSAGLLLAAAFTMKHNAAAWGFPLVVAITWRDGWRRAAWFSAASAVPSALISGWLEVASGGMFSTYLLAVPASHPSLFERWWPGLPRELGNALPVPLALLIGWSWRRSVQGAPPWAVFLPAVAGMGAGWFGTYVRPPVDSGLSNAAASIAFFAVGALPVALGIWAWRGRDRGELVPPAALGLATVLITGAMRAHNGGYLNVLAPLFLVVAVGGGVVLGKLVRAGHPTFAALVVVAHCVWVGASFDTNGLRPTAQDLAAGARFVEACRAVDGPVLSPFAAWLPTYAGKPPSLHYMGVWDLDYPGNPLRPGLSEIDAAVRDQRWPLVLGGSQKFGHGLAQAYPEERVLLDPKTQALFPKTGWKARPNRLLRPAR